MDQIYRYASQVFVWIGTRDESTPQTLAMIRQIVSTIHMRCGS
jgi:hypothetical protein